MQTNGVAPANYQKIYGNFKGQTTYSYITREDIASSNRNDNDENAFAIYHRYVVSNKTAYKTITIYGRRLVEISE